MIGERLKRARAAAGLSMRALAEQTGVSHNMIKKYEHDESMPGSAVLLKLGQALEVRAEYFFRPTKIKLANVEYRKAANTPKKVLDRIEADVLDQAERWQELANLWPDFPLKPFAMPQQLPERIDQLEQIDDFAEQLRNQWQLGLNPVPHLIDLLEAKGILVITTPIAEGEKFDGLQASIAGQPVIVVAEQWPGDRQRFTLAHELGHLLLDGRLSAELSEEQACNRFAGAFLLPASTLRNQLGAKRHMLEVQELYLLKHEFGLSMAACLYRAKDLDIITPQTHKRLSMVFSKQGWRKLEPGNPCPQEQTLLFQQLVYRALAEGIVGESKAAELLGVAVHQFHRTRKMELTDAAANQ